MTTIAMTAGMAHIALGLGVYAEFRAPMTVVVIGGLVPPTLISFDFVSVAYTLVDDLKSFPGRRRAKKVARGLAAGDGVADIGSC